MLFDLLKTDYYNYPHLANLSQGELNLVLNAEDSFVVHFLKSDIYCAEIAKSAPIDTTKKVLDVVKSADIDLFETTNESLFSALKDTYKYGYSCLQFCLKDAGINDEKIKPLDQSDLDFVIANYHDEGYLRYLFSKKQILGYYENDKLIGFILKHIDGSVGAIFIAEEKRRMGYGLKMTKAAVSYFNDPLIYSQVLENNIASIQMHIRMNAIKCPANIYWLHNRGFSY